MKKRLFILCIPLLILAGCQYDDICGEKEPATPRLVIKFFDKEHPGLVKEVTNFNVKVLENDSLYFDKPVNDTLVAIPLRTYENSTTYEFIINQDSQEGLEELKDTITFEYTPKNVYIGRACGFKTNFYDFSISHPPENANWIEHIEIPHSNSITNEKQALLYIYH